MQYEGGPNEFLAYLSYNSKISKSNIFQKNVEDQKFICPDVSVSCNCLDPLSCPPIMPYIKTKRFGELSKFKFCQFEGSDKKYCCPDYTPVRVTESFPLPSDLTSTETASTKTTSTDTTTLETTTTETATTKIEQPETEVKTGVRSGFLMSPYLDEFKDKCGQVIDVRVVGGTEVSDHAFPWAVALGYDFGDDSKRPFHCGGTLITDQVLLIFEGGAGGGIK